MGPHIWVKKSRSKQIYLNRLVKIDKSKLTGLNELVHIDGSKYTGQSRRQVQIGRSKKNRSNIIPNIHDKID